MDNNNIKVYEVSEDDFLITNTAHNQLTLLTSGNIATVKAYMKTFYTSTSLDLRNTEALAEIAASGGKRSLGTENTWLMITVGDGYRVMKNPDGTTETANVMRKGGLKKLFKKLLQLET